jgi:CHAT domain-containing protein
MYFRHMRQHIKILLPVLLLAGLTLIQSDSQANPDKWMEDGIAAYRRGDYSEALKELGKAKAAYQKQEDIDGVANAWRYQATSLLFQGQYAKCEEELGKLQAYLEQHSEKDSYLWAKYYQIRGALYSEKAEFSESIRLLRLSATLFSGLGNEYVVDAVNANNLIANTYLDLSKFDSALLIYKDSYHRLIQLPKAESDTNALANTLGNIGAAFQYLNQWDSAAIYHRRSRQLYAASLGNENPKVANQVFNLALVAYERGYYDQSIDQLQQALAIYEAQAYDHHPELSELYGSLGAVYAAKGEWDAAINSLYMDSLHTLKTFGSQHPFMAICYQEMANTRLEMGQPAEAVRLLEKAMSIFDLHYTGHRNQSKSLALLGKAYFQSGNYQQGILALQQAELIEEVKTSGTMFQIYYWLAKNSLAMGKNIEAKAYAKQSIAAIPSSHEQKGPTVAKGYLLLAEIESVMNHPKTAIPYLKRALTATTTGDKVLFSREYVNAAYALAIAKEQQGQLEEALTYIDLAQKEANRIRREFAYESSAYEWAKQVEAINNTGISLCYKLYQQQDNNALTFLNRAFKFSENNKAFRLQQHTVQLKMSDLSKMSDKAIATATELRANLIYYRELLEDKLNGANTTDLSLEQLQEKIFSLSSDYDRFVRRVQQHHPEYFSLAFATDAPGVTAVMKTLPKNSLLLEFHMDNVYMYLFALQRKGKPVFMRVPAAPVREASRQMANAIHYNSDSMYRLSAYALYDLTLGKLGILPGKQNLVVVADGDLHDVPLEALLTQMVTPGTSPKNYPYLLNRNGVMYAPSAALFVMKQPIKPKWGRLVTVFAPEFNFNKADAFRELAAIKTHFKSRIISGEESHKDKIGHWMQQSDVLHFATHGILDNDRPLKSYLTLGKDTTEGNRLYAYDLYRMQTKARLVTLAACYSGSGPVTSGEGKINMARGFMYAGAPNIVMSLWAVPDNSTGKILSSFYGLLAKGKDKTEALRQAKLDYIQQADPSGAVPLYWAGKIIVGDKYPLRIHTPWATRNWLLVAAVLLLAGGILGRFVYGRFTV